MAKVLGSYCGCSRRKVTRGEEGMSHRTLRRSRLKKGYEERESVIVGEVSSLG